MLSRAIHQIRQNFVAYLALLFAVSGTAMAAKPLITGADIEDDSVTGADVDESSLAVAPSAAEPFHVVGVGEFENGWANWPGHATAYYKDPWGVVHLKGVVTRTPAEPSTIFLLPPGYRTAEADHLDFEGGSVGIYPDGAVYSASWATITRLDGITFRADD